MGRLLEIRPAGVELVARTHPLRDRDVVRRFLLPGRTVAEIVAESGVRRGSPVAVYIGDRRIAADAWATTRPLEGEMVLVRALAAGGGGGQGGGKSVGRILAMIAVLALTIVTAGATAPLLGLGTTAVTATGATVFTASTVGSIVAGVAAAAVNLAGTLAINAIFPPPGLGGNPLATQSHPFITGTRNTARRYGRLPRVYGTHKIVPDLLAEPWIEHVGEETYLRLLFCLGRGPLQLSNLRIGENPLFKPTTTLLYTGKMKADGYYRDVQVELRQGYDTDDPITLYPVDIHTESVSAKLKGRYEGKVELIPGGYGATRKVGGEAGEKNAVIRRTERDADEISIEVAFPVGLIHVRPTSGSTDPQTVKLHVDYRAVGATNWTVVTDEDARRGQLDANGFAEITEETKKPFFRGFRWAVTRGQYEVRLYLQSGPGDDTEYFRDCWWTTLRTIKTDPPPVAQSGLCIVAMRIRSSNQLNGSVEDFSAVGTSILRLWNGSAFVMTPTGNSAAVFLDVFQGAGVKHPAPDAQMDLDGLKADMVRCTLERRSCDLVFTDETVWERARIAAATARAGLDIVDGQYGLLFDDESTTPVQLLSPRNTWGFGGEKLLPELPHALKCRYRSPAKDWELVEEITYDDGYSSDGAGATEPATIFEEMDFVGYTNPVVVWSDARYHLASARLRSEMWRVSADMEHLACRRGSFVRLMNDVISVGISATRIREVQSVAGEAVAVLVEGTCEMEAATSYGVVIRKSDHAMTHVARQVVTVVGLQNVLEFSTPIPAADPQPEDGDLLVFGLLGQETLECLVKAKAPGPQLSAQVHLVPLARAVYDADQATPPEWAKDQIAGEVPADTRTPTDQPAAPIVKSTSSTSSPATNPTTTAPPATKPDTSHHTAPAAPKITVVVQPPPGPKKKKPKPKK